MKKNLFKTMLLAGSLTVLFSFASFAGEWKQDTTGWWWQNDDGSYPTSQWQWVDGNNDGISECYYFDPNGYMMVNTEVEGNTVNGDGAWTVNGIVQTQGTTQQTANDTFRATIIIKPEYIDLLGKDKAYVIEKLGSNYEDLGLITDGGITMNVVMFNTDKGGFVTEFYGGELLALGIMGDVLFNENMKDLVLELPAQTLFQNEQSDSEMRIINTSPLIILAKTSSYGGELWMIMLPELALQEE